VTETITTRCAIAGGGPAGMMLGFLLARAGIDVVVLEKHADFLRDFRGDTIHPSTLQLMQELGLLQALLKRPHNEASKLTVQVGVTPITVADFSWLPRERAFVALMPQWDFLDFIAGEAKRYPSFHLLMQANVTGLIEEQGRVVGVHAATPDGRLDVRARLVVGCDGRNSTIRKQAGLEIEDIGAPIDVLWMRVSRLPGDPGTGGRLDAGSFFAVLDRGDYFQLAYVIRKGDAERVMQAGLPAFRQTVAKALPFLAGRVDELKSWDDVKLLTVTIDRLHTWYRAGLLCIGDAAHAMSPVGGVGINLAIQDAVAASNLLAEPLREKRLRTADLDAVQRRREWPARVTQQAQVAIHNELLAPVLAGTAAPTTLPLPLRLLQRLPLLRRLPARLVGIGVRPERVRTSPHPPT
jgi:2-polyprenyl-6-methoxyphenol hydroxylase-like FAD-dependent oxidoreductase